MKIPASIRKAHEAQQPDNARLKARVDTLISSSIDNGWHYESRVKELESFALKLEAGRVTDPNQLEDFFGCTIVVRNSAEVPRAEAFLRKHFTVIDRRPPDAVKTSKRSEAFPFDDLRLYVRWRDDPSLPPSGLTDLTFEVQVKTFLMHAWLIATHDLTYKTDDVSWGRERIASQIRAMLEHAEVSIAEAEKLADSEGLRLENDITTSVKEAITLLRSYWTAAELPQDVRRLAQTVVNLCKAGKIELADIRAVLDAEATAGRGARTLNLSPYGIVIQSLLNQRVDVVRRLCSADGKRFRVLLPAELEVPESIASTRLTGGIRLPSG